MNPILRRVLGESVEALPVIEDTEPVSIHRCPHCKDKIHEKHIYEENGVTYHSDCGKPIKFPAPDPATIPAWLRPYMP